MKKLVKLGAVAFTGLLTVSLVTPTAQAGQRITPETYGMHAFTGEPEVESGAMRLNMFPPWNKVETKKGQYDWTDFDATVDRYESWDSGQLMYVFAGTPKWAGKKVKKPKLEKQGKNSTSAPTKMKYFKDYATQVVKRYKGRISQYQTWNEMTSPQFWQGTPAQMAKMTKILKKVVKKRDPNAQVLSASVQTHKPAYLKKGKSYLRELKNEKWPIDVATAHGYASGLNNRYEQLKEFRGYVRECKAPKRIALWDTETNQSNGFRSKLQERAFISRAYLDSARLGFERTYWYFWTPNCEGFGSLQLCPEAKANQYYDTMYDMTVGSRVKKCSQSGKLVKCSFKNGPDGPFDMVYAYKGKTSYKFSGKKEICPADGGSCSVASKKIKVNLLPQRVAAPKDN